MAIRERGPPCSATERICHVVNRLDLDGILLKVLNLEAPLLSKQGARPKDQMDAALLRQALAVLKLQSK